MQPTLQIFISIMIAFLGLSFGSFMNCLIWRIHSGLPINGRSMCPKCKKKITWYDNIPVLSYILLKAKCRHCKKSISLQYPIVEFVTAALFFLVFTMTTQSTPQDLLYTSNFWLLVTTQLFTLCVLVVIFLYDLKWYLILDIVTMPSIVVIFILNLLTGVSWYAMLISGIIGGSFFLIQFIISKGRWIGGGDIRLGFLMGIILGWPNILVALFIAYILGSIIGVGLIVIKKKKMDSQVPFGVFLTSATLVTMLWGQEILTWYLNFL